MSPETWINLLYLYGPMALFVFMVFVLLGKARNTEGLNQKQQRIQEIALSLVWVFIFGLGVTIVLIWWRINLPHEYVIRGSIQNLRDPETISTNDNLYLRRVYKTAFDIDYEWRILSASPPTEPVVFLLQETPESKTALRYRIPVSEKLYRGSVEISYDRSTRRMSLENGKYRSVMEPQVDTAEALPPPRGGLRVVHADATSPPEELIRALDSNDPIIRGNAKKSLVSSGRPVVAIAEKASSDPSNSPRLRAEALGVVEELVGPAEVKRDGWQPVDLSSDANLGLFALSKEGEVSKIVFASSGTQIQPAFTIPRAYSPLGIAEDQNALYAITGSSAGCTVFRYLPSTGQVSSFLIVNFACTAVAAHDGGFYVAGGTANEIRFWQRWGGSQQGASSWPDMRGIGAMWFDAWGNRILMGDNLTGMLYAASVPGFKRERLASGMGWINSVVCDQAEILVASGKKVLFLTPGGAGQSPPGNFKLPNAKRVSGVAFDGAGGVWISDYEKGSVFGPIPVS
ncbi:MAG: hypothetical protein JO340_17775 [Acidobacteriaceae bacterium]|nr:hypothetical protein [Acidobacteriaceae bacterium]